MPVGPGDVKSGLHITHTSHTSTYLTICMTVIHSDMRINNFNYDQNYNYAEFTCVPTFFRNPSIVSASITPGKSWFHSLMVFGKNEL